MKSAQLTAERITELSLRLAMASTQRSVGLADLQFRHIEGALRWHRASCRPINLARRVAHAAFRGRLCQGLALIAEQRAMLRMAADEGGDDKLVFEALLALSTAVARVEFRSCPSPKLRLAMAACRLPAQRARLANLVRGCEIESAPEGLRLVGVTRRRIWAYGALAAFILWPGAIFLTMAFNDELSPDQLAGYLIGTVLIAGWLTRGLFTELQTDEDMVVELNSSLRPRAAATEAVGN